MDIDKMYKFALVQSTMRQVCEEQNILLRMNLEVGFRSENGRPWHGAAQPQWRLILIDADPFLITPERLWWTFCHELAHVMHGHDPNASYMTILGNEVEAWKTARIIANHSAWPATKEFDKQRVYALGTYGIAA